MKEEMLKYLRSKDEDGFENWCHPQQHWIEDFIECFFDQYQPDSSKREDSIETLERIEDDRFIHKTVRSGNLIMRYSIDKED